MGPRLRRAQARVSGAAGPVPAADLQAVGVGPATGPREAARRPRDRRQQVAHDASVRRSHVAAGAEHVPGAPVMLGDGPPPVAVLYRDRPPGAVEEPLPQAKVVLRPAAIQLDGVEPESHQCLHITAVESLAGRPELAADAVVAIPPSREAQPVSVRIHAGHVGEALHVDHRVELAVLARVVVEKVGAAAARLPVVIQTHIAVSQITQ
mmetsp:Transcript_7156/g.21870  ORF Transcript_7156/g.21870 Transcript_7156/m.21870 type:complete len:208 (+) Transcript_7156:694-1317(+)